MHASWVSSGAGGALGSDSDECSGPGSAPRFDGRLFIWGESTERLGRKPKGRGARGPYPRHPFQATRDEVVVALLALAQLTRNGGDQGNVSGLRNMDGADRASRDPGDAMAASGGPGLQDGLRGGREVPRTKAAKTLALLPSQDGRPEPSPLLLREVLPDGDRDGDEAAGAAQAAEATRIAAAAGTAREDLGIGSVGSATSVGSLGSVGSVGIYQISGISLSGADAVRILAVVPEDGDLRLRVDGIRIVLGPDFRFWMRAAKLALEFLARQRLVPCIVALPGGDEHRGNPGAGPGARAGTGFDTAAGTNAMDNSRVGAGAGAAAAVTFRLSARAVASTRSGGGVRVVRAEADTAKARERAGWRLALDLPADLARVRELAQSMPGICRALLAPEHLDGDQAEEAATPEAMARMLPSRDGLLQSFFDTTVDETARLWLSRERRRRIGSVLEGGDLWLAEVALNLGASADPAVAWLRALGEKRPIIEWPARDVETLHRAIWEWLGEIGQGAPAGAFRTCFRLVPPGDEEYSEPAMVVGCAEGYAGQADRTRADRTKADGGQGDRGQADAGHAGEGVADAAGDANAGRASRTRQPAQRPGAPHRQEPSPGDDIWIVEYLLQAVDDPSLVVPAARVWQEKGCALEFLGRRFENPQERLLADLGRASRVFPAIEHSLKLARPEACYLTTAEAYSFLREVAPLLEESGFGVLAPPWWDRAKGKAARLGVRLKVRTASPASPAADAAPGGSHFGLDSLVEYDWQVALGDQVMDKDEFRRLVALKVPLVRVRGEWVEIRPEDVEAAIQFWDKRRKAGTATLGQALSAALQAGSGDGESGLPVVAVDAGGRVADLIRRLSAGGEKIQELAAPREFVGSLRPYQVRGYSWLSFLTEWGIGACLADDMGLGKTIQVIALVLRAKEDGTLKAPVLLVCPTSVVGNWRRELERFAPSLRVMVHHGVDRLSGAEFAAKAAAHDVVVTTYSLVYRDEEHLRRLEWHGIVLDEAQNIKNPDTRQSQSVRRLQAASRAALTGTPIENRLSELWSIMDFLNPGYLGPAADFRRKFALPIERYRDQERAERLRRLVGPFILRRLKTDPRVIQDLPEKQEMKVYCTLTREQATLYEAVVKDMLHRIEGASGMERRGAILAALLKLKQVCNHPAQFLRDRSALDGRSGKLARLVEMLDEVGAEGNRALVFSQFAEMGAMLRDYLRGALGREVVFLHGGVPQKARDEMVQRFQNDPDGPPVFVLSLKAGGFGLNLTRANYVFHFDRWWNPAVENQATDRAFRIGQTQKVQVYKFICSGTLEERIDGMIESKKFLADNVIGTGEDWITEMSTDELRDLLLLRGEALADADADGD